MQKQVLPVVAWLILTATTAAAAPTDWFCTNENLPQVTCGSDGCQVETGMSPILANYDSSGMLSACYYTGCHEGPVTSWHTDGGVLTLIARNADWIHKDGSTETVTLSIRTDEGIGVLIAAGFFTPVRCRPFDGSNDEGAPYQPRN